MSEWILAYDGYDPDQEQLREALCTVGNGYFGTRGAGADVDAGGPHYPGTYMAGVLNRLSTEIEGHTVTNASIVNLPNWLPLRIRPEGGAWFRTDAVELQEYRQELDVRRGTLTRFVRYTDADGRTTRLTERRFAHMEDPHLAGIELTVVPEGWSGRLEVLSALDGGVTNAGVQRYSGLDGQHLEPLVAEQVDGETIALQVRTNQSHVRVAEAARTRVWRGADEECRVDAGRTLEQRAGYVAQRWFVDVHDGEPIALEKIVAIYSSRDAAISESREQARIAIDRAGGFESLLDRHVLAWGDLWRRFRVRVQAEERVERALHVHLFHILQTVSPHSIDADVGVPARGLHGEAYRGHIFWDELFVFPFINLRYPLLGRSLLRYRYRRLNEARWRARESGYRGALFPWQSGSDGREESQTLHLNPRSGRWIPDNSQLQRHIDIAIAYNVWQYYQSTGDVGYLAAAGAEMLVEIARFWSSIAEYNRATDRYEICGVMGPDEYHDGYPWRDEPGLDNNAYTNVMAAWVLCRAIEALDLLPRQARDALDEYLDLSGDEVQRWEDLSRKMYVPFHEDADGNPIVSQFEGYERLEELDWEKYRSEHGDAMRLDRILEAEDDTPNRYKASKQADVLMLAFLLSSDELTELFARLGYAFDSGMLLNNIEYYLRRTANGSTLSAVVDAWLLARRDRERSWSYFTEALDSDIEDVQGGTTPEGIHLGAMAGTVDIVQRAYTGMEMRGDALRFDPQLPDELKQLEFDIDYRGHWLHLDVSHQRMRFTTRPGNVAPIRVVVRNGQEHELELAPGETREVAL